MSGFWNYSWVFITPLQVSYHVNGAETIVWSVRFADKNCYVMGLILETNNSLPGFVQLVFFGENRGHKKSVVALTLINPSNKAKTVDSLAQQERRKFADQQLADAKHMSPFLWICRG